MSILTQINYITMCKCT